MELNIFLLCKAFHRLCSCLVKHLISNLDFGYLIAFPNFEFCLLRIRDLEFDSDFGLRLVNVTMQYNGIKMGNWNLISIAILSRPILKYYVAPLYFF